MRVAIADLGERAAICASAACLAHCLALPLLIVLLPSLATVLAIPESFHAWMLAFAVPSALVALLLGHRVHGASGPLLAGAAGLVLLATARSRWARPRGRCP